MNLVIVTRCIVRAEKEGKLLIIKRSLQDRYSPGLWECPGGKKEEWQSVALTARTETLEETGITIHAMRNIRLVDNRLVTDGVYAGRRFLTYFGVASVPAIQEVVLSHEHEDSRWVTYEEALAMKLVRETQVGLLAMKKYIT
jgi:8-oxo-dGTP pyrophosphatase MutT (NUDIX family)